LSLSDLITNGLPIFIGLSYGLVLSFLLFYAPINILRALISLKMVIVGYFIYIELSWIESLFLRDASQIHNSRHYSKEWFILEASTMIVSLIYTCASLYFLRRIPEYKEKRCFILEYITKDYKIFLISSVIFLFMFWSVKRFNKTIY
jgi:hypothetical protein